VNTFKVSRHSLVIGLVLLGTSLCYLFLSIARGPRPPESGYTTELYALLARSFLQGKTTLPIEPRPELLLLRDPYDPEANSKYRLHDASLYKGHYYLYFGAVPAVTLFAPYHLLTGRDLPNRVAVPIFCIGGYLCSCYLFFLLAAQNRWPLPLWLICSAILCLGSMSMVGLILRRPSFYEVAIAGGYFFVMGGFLSLAKAAFMSETNRKLFLAAGMMFGLAVGCRPDLVVICGSVAVALAIRSRRDFGALIPLIAGMALCGVFLAWYNYARFGNPMEFGVTYQLGALSFAPGETSTLSFNPIAGLRALDKFLFLLPQVDTIPPFFHTVFINPLQGRPGTPLWTEDMVGLFPVAPIALLGYFMPLLCARRWIGNQLLDGTSRWLLYCIYCAGGMVCAAVCGFGWAFGRYLVDFAPLFILLGVSVAVILWQTLSAGPKRYAAAWILGSAAIYGVIVNVALAIPRLDLVLKFLHRAQS
jgi:hypothetical protein